MAVTSKDDWISEQDLRAATGISRYNLVRWRQQGLLPLPGRHFAGRGTGSTSSYPPFIIPMVRRLDELRRQSPHDVDGWTWGLWLDGFPIDIKKWCDWYLARAHHEIARLGGRDALQAAIARLTTEPAPRSNIRRPLVGRLSSRQERSLLSWTVDVIPGASSTKTLDDLASPSFDALKRAAGLVGAWNPPDPELFVDNLSLTTFRIILSEATSAEMEQARQDCRTLERLAKAAEAVDWRSARKHLGVERGRSAQPVAPIISLSCFGGTRNIGLHCSPVSFAFDEAKTTRDASPRSLLKPAGPLHSFLNSTALNTGPRPRHHDPDSGRPSRHFVYRDWARLGDRTGATTRCAHRCAGDLGYHHRRGAHGLGDHRTTQRLTMNADTDQLYGRVRNRILTLSGNSPSIRVANGLLVIQDGPTAWVGPGEAPPVEQRMTTLRIARGERTVDHIIATRPTGFITIPALQWLSETGIAFTLLTFNGSVVFSTGPAGTDQPALRRAQALASTNSVGFAIMKAILQRKLQGQAEVARTMLPDGEEAAAAIDGFAHAIERAQSVGQVLAAEAAGASIYWMRWSTLPIRFARRHRVQDGWQQFGLRHSTLTESPHHAVSPANAILNYLYTVAEGQLTISLIGAGIDPGIAVFHQDQDRRRSMALDALEVLRPLADAWALRWLTKARFAKRDFSERPDGSVRITRPLSSHLAMTSVIWRRAAEIVAGWLREALTTAKVRELPPPLPHFPAPRRAWSGMTPPVPRTCAECGSVLPRTKRRLCSQECAVNWHLNVAKAETVEELAEVASGDTRTRNKIRRHQAERFLWDVTHSRGNDRRSQLRLYYKETIEPKLASLTLSTAVLATELGVTERYVQKIRGGVIPHARHFQKLAKLAGVKHVDP